jgi:hypothetical protein
LPKAFGFSLRFIVNKLLAGFIPAFFISGIVLNIEQGLSLLFFLALPSDQVLKPGIKASCSKPSAKKALGVKR